MIELDLTLDIDASPDTVFQRWSDPAARDRWQSGVQDLRVEGEAGAATWRFAQSALGRNQLMEGRFEVFEPGRRWVEVTTSGSVRIRVEVQLEPRGDGCRARTRVQVELGGTLGRLGERVARVPIKRQAEGDQQRVKALVEGG
jgi:carbon monoxide dehydrogenase subunit G